jgi:hypothetical protein
LFTAAYLCIGESIQLFAHPFANEAGGHYYLLIGLIDDPLFLFGSLETSNV